MLRSLLAERLNVRTHVEPREQTVLVLTTARPDRRLGPGVIRRGDCDATPCISGGGARPMEGLARLLSAMRRQLVYDETGLAGQYDVEMTFRPDDVSPDAADARPAFVSAIGEQLGLKLTPQRRPVDVLVVEAIDRPTPD